MMIRMGSLRVYERSLARISTSLEFDGVSFFVTQMFGVTLGKRLSTRAYGIRVYPALWVMRSYRR